MKKLIFAVALAFAFAGCVAPHHHSNSNNGGGKYHEKKDKSAKNSEFYKNQGHKRSESSQKRR